VRVRSRPFLVLCGIAALSGGPLAGACRAESPADTTRHIILEHGYAVDVRDARLSPVEGRPYHSVCFRGRDRSRCGSFLITEAGVLSVLRGDLGDRREQKMLGFLEYGAMVNIGPSSAVGVTALGESGTNHNRVGFRARYRRWLGHGFSIDLAPGVIIWDFEDRFTRYKSPGLIGMVALDAGGLLGIMVEGEVARIEWNQGVYDGTSYSVQPQHLTDFTLRAGVRGGSYVGVGATLLSAIALAALAASFDGMY
jgi:hypothetical protein